jgi:hypothetical protein
MRIAHLILIVALAVVKVASGGGSLLAFAAPHAQVQVQMTATAGYGSQGAYLIPEWFPVRVTLTNPAGGDARRVRVSVNSVGNDPAQPLAAYSREVDLPAQSRKEVTLYAYSTTYNGLLNVRLLEGNTVLADLQLTLSPHEQQSNLLIGVLSSDPALLNVLNSEGMGHLEYGPQQPYSSQGLPTSAPIATIVHLGMNEIPTLSVALDGLDVIVVDDLDTGTLTASQRASIAAWVGRGGMLIGLARPGGADALSGLVDLLPVTLGEPRAVDDLTSLGALVSTPITPTGQVLSPVATLRTGRDISTRALASQGGAPLVAVRELGRGHVAYIGLSPAVAPLKSWDGTVPLFKRLIAEHPVRPSAGAEHRSSSYSSSGIFSSYGGLFDIPGLDLPSAGVLGLFLLVYIIIIGPVNFIVLRRLHRGELAWLTIPAVVLLFSLGAYAIGFGAKGGDLLAVRASVVHTTPGLAEGSVEHFFGIFSPQRNTYNAEVSTDSAVTEVNASGYLAYPDSPMIVSGGGDTGPTQLSGLNVGTYSLRAFMAESAVSVESPLEADLYLGDNLIEGTLRNRSGSELRDVALVHGDQTRLIGTLAPGQEAKVQLAISQQAFTAGSPERLLDTPPGVSSNGSPFGYGGRSISEAQRRYNRQVQLLSTGLGELVSNAAPSDMSVIALAWGPSAPEGFSIPGRSYRAEELNLWTARLEVRGDGPVTPRLKSGSVPFTVYAPGNDPRWLGSGEGLSSVVINPYVDLMVRLPQGTRSGELHLEYSAAIGLKVTVSAYNVRTGAWDRLGELSTTTTTAIGIPAAENYIGPAGDVTFRLIPEEGATILGLSPLGFRLR